MQDALRRSANHWQRLADGEQRVGEDICGNDCACCKAYRKPYVNACGICPLYNDDNGCCNGLWNIAADAKMSCGIDSPRFRQAAWRVLDYICARMRP